MRVLTYNIAGNRGRRRNGYLEQIAELIRKTDADVVGLQEVVHYPGDPMPPEEVLCEMTGMHAVYLPAHEGKRHSIGNARRSLMSCRMLSRSGAFCWRWTLTHVACP
jgi:endonuclease/exonuclease/phosphatase family metal-dependent hydrolase